MLEFVLDRPSPQDAARREAVKLQPWPEPVVPRTGRYQERLRRLAGGLLPEPHVPPRHWSRGLWAILSILFIIVVLLIKHLTPTPSPPRSSPDTRPGRTFSGHYGHVESVAVTPNGRGVISGSGDKTVRVWDLATGREVRVLTGHTGPVNAVAVTPNGRQVISGAWDGTVRVWDLATGGPVRTLIGHNNWVEGWR